MRELSFLSFEESMFIIKFFNLKILSYVLFDKIVHFIIQKLKNKHKSLETEKAKSSHFDRMRGDKNHKLEMLLYLQYFPEKYKFKILN